MELRRARREALLDVGAVIFDRESRASLLSLDERCGARAPWGLVR